MNNIIEMKILAAKLIPLMITKLQNEENNLLVKQIQFIYAALGAADPKSDFLSTKLELDSATKELFKNNLLEALKSTDATLSAIRIIKQRIGKI